MATAAGWEKYAEELEQQLADAKSQLEHNGAPNQEDPSSELASQLTEAVAAQARAASRPR